MYGWRCRIGLIIPSDNTVMESEFNKLFRDIPGVSVHATRVFLEELSVETLLQMKEGLKRACEELKSAEMDVLAYGCTSGSFVKGLHFDQEIIQEIEENLLEMIRAPREGRQLRIQGCRNLNPFFRKWLFNQGDGFTDDLIQIGLYNLKGGFAGKGQKSSDDVRDSGSVPFDDFQIMNQFS